MPLPPPVGRQHLHVAGEDDQVDPLLLEERAHRGVVLRARRGRDREDAERDAEVGRDGRQVGVVADDHRHLARQLAGAVALRLVEDRAAGRYGLGVLGASVVGNPGVRAMVDGTEKEFRAREIIDGLLRKHLPEEFRFLKIPGSRPGTGYD